jgi:mannose-6-phosphate isomerase-like protein (cupin superfamily)
MAKVTNVWKTVEEHRKGPKPRRFMRVAQEDDLMVALNYYEPGYKNEFHYHEGTSQSFLVLKGRLTIRTMDDSQDVVEHHLDEGDCVMIADSEYYQLHNETDAPLVLYQAKQPADRIVIFGKGPADQKAYFGVTPGETEAYRAR